MLWPLQTDSSYSTHPKRIATHIRRWRVQSQHGDCIRINRKDKIVGGWTPLSIKFSLFLFSLARPPSIKKPPDVLLPDPAISAHWYSELWVRYPLGQQLLSLHHGYTFKAICEFRVILCDISQCAFGKANSGTETNISLPQAFQFRSTLNDWYNTLPNILSAENISAPCHLNIQ